jgi:hypothetical protein
MASHNVRPRVLAAISELEAFTVPDLVQAAGLPDRKVAYAQLSKLSKEGLLEERLLPPIGNHRPLTSYRLKSDYAVRERLATELASYRPPTKAMQSVGLAEAAIAEANTALSEIEATLDMVVKGKSELSGLKSLDSLLDSARTDIGTALLEYGTTVSEEKTPAHPVMVARTRWRQLDEKLKKLRSEGEIRFQVQPWLRDVAAGVASALISGVGVPPTVGAVIATLFTKEMASTIAGLRKPARPAAEVLLDELRGEKDYPWVPLLRSACRLTDADILLKLLGAFLQVGEWVAYDNESALYLLTKQLRQKEWLTAYESIRGRLCELREREKTRTSLYSFESSQLDPDKYMALTKNCRVSVIANTELPFLGFSELVRPTLMMDRGKTFETLDCEFLRPGASLHAYGPLIHDLRCLPGAPALRVAGSLGIWGVSLQKHLHAVIESFENGRSLLVIQAEKQSQSSIHERVKPVLNVETILVG